MGEETFACWPLYAFECHFCKKIYKRMMRNHRRRVKLTTTGTIEERHSDKEETVVHPSMPISVAASTQQVLKNALMLYGDLTILQLIIAHIRLPSSALLSVQTMKKHI